MGSVEYCKSSKVVHHDFILLAMFYYFGIQLMNLKEIDEILTIAFHFAKLKNIEKNNNCLVVSGILPFKPCCMNFTICVHNPLNQ